MPKISISYRRSDSQDITGRIFDRLVQRFGRELVFRDIDSIRPGIDFRKQIAEALEETDVLLAIVGPRWLGRGEGAEARINDEADPVRVEIEAALKRQIPVIPVIVGKGDMPTTGELPVSMVDFAFRHAVMVDGGRDFDHHVAALIRSLEHLLQVKSTVSDAAPAAHDPASTSSMAGRGGPRSSRALAASIIGALVVLAVGAAALYWHGGGAADRSRGEDRRETVAGPIDPSSQQIFDRYANSIVAIDARWRSYDQRTGRPLFQKILVDSKTGEARAAFVRLSSGEVVRWLTLEDGEHVNFPIGGEVHGAGFVVTEKGLVLANRHIAAGWTKPFRATGPGGASKNSVYVFPYGANIGRQKIEVLPMDAPEIEALAEWVPDDGGYLFEPLSPIALGGLTRYTFKGRNDVLEISFPGNRAGMNAMVVQVATDVDLAIFKLDAAPALKPLELATEDRMVPGAHMVMLSYSSAGVVPALADGTIAAVGGDAFQLTNVNGVTAAGAPVIDAKGRVIGVLTETRLSGSGVESFAVPIKRARALLATERAVAK